MRARADDQPSGGGAEPRYRIGLVARRVGVAAHTLRAWERRYGGLSPGRMPSGGRLYSDDDVLRLRLLKQLTDQGHAIGSIATLPVAELTRLASRGAVLEEPALPLDRKVAEVMRERFLASIASFDLAAASRVLSHAALAMAPEELVCDVLGPLLHEIGARWERGELSVAHEHAASSLLRTELGVLLRSAQTPLGARIAVAATLPGEQHEFGALLAALLAALRGYRVVYLGTNLPVTDIVRAVREARADLVLVSLVNDQHASKNDDLCQLRAELPPSVGLCVGGRGAGELSPIEHVRIVPSLRELAAILTP